MNYSQSKLGFTGILLGSMALLLALTSFWAGPFSPQPSLESSIAETAASIRQATIDTLSGKEVQKTYRKKKWNLDKIIDVIIPTISAFAIILAVFSFINREPNRIAGSAAALGISAIVFQFIAMYAMALLVVIIIAAVLISLGADSI